MTNYKEEAEILYRRVQKATGKMPTQQSVNNYITDGGKRPLTDGQAKFVELVLSVQGIKGYTKRDGTKVEGYTKTYRKWTKDDVEYLKTHTVEEAVATFGGRHTRQAIAKKKQRMGKGTFK